jgi:hypothetical protein
MAQFLSIDNATKPYIGSLTEAVALGRVVVTLAADGSHYRAELKARQETFAGKGASAVLALQDLAATITKAAIKRERRGRAPDRVRVAATLLQCGPN